MTKDERIKELESAAMQLFDMVHESENIQNKIKANDLYDTITVKNLSQHLVIETNPIGKDYIILSKSMYRDKNGDNKTACYEWVNGFRIYYTHKDNIHSR
ncbi:unnamed protein product [marine sediment metagenome]|uniref:Uncharacterized protein n=1 Tax=marine sediment metagenome TaxID=412755 RepID=X1DUC2_9ZZZZ